MANTFEYITGLRAFYMYSNMANWKPHIGQKISFKCKGNSNCDDIVTTGKNLLKGRIGAFTVGHISIEYL